MSRVETLLNETLEMLSDPSPKRIYQWVQHLDSEYVTSQYPELLVVVLRQRQDIDASIALAYSSALTALKYALALQLHTHSRRVLAAACVCRAFNDNADYWQAKGINQPLWLAAFQPRQHRDSYFFCQWALALAAEQLRDKHSDYQLTDLLQGYNRARYQPLLQQLMHPASWSLGTVLQHHQSKQLVHFIRATSDHWVVLSGNFSAVSTINSGDFHHWQARFDKPISDNNLALLAQQSLLTQQLPTSNYQAPKKLLAAIKRYTSGTGALAPVINYIQRHPMLADSLREAARTEMISANDPCKMELKHLYLWLGGKRASIALATATLQQQFAQQRVPLQQSLMQRLGLLTVLLKNLAKTSQKPLPAPASLLTLLSGADLFRHKQLLQSDRWPHIQELSAPIKRAWVNPDYARNDIRWTQQLISRWQLDKSLAPLLTTQQEGQNSLAALMCLGNIAVVRAYHPQVTLGTDTRGAMQQALSCLNLTMQQFERICWQSIFQYHPYSPIIELDHS